MREVPYETDQDVRARSRRDEMYERINDFLARGGRGRSGLFKIKSYICICNIKFNAYGNIC